MQEAQFQAAPGFGVVVRGRFARGRDLRGDREYSSSTDARAVLVHPQIRQPAEVESALVQENRSTELGVVILREALLPVHQYDRGV